MILRNDFHNTEIQINLQGRTYLTSSQVQRAKAALCVPGCTCSDGVAGERPAKQFLDGDTVYLVGNQEGEAIIVPY